MRKSAYPENDAKTVWLANAEDNISLGTLLSFAGGYFGESAQLNMIDIEYVRWTHESSCGCCSINNGAYGDYYKITLRDEPCEYTKPVPLIDLIEG